MAETPDVPVPTEAEATAERDAAIAATIKILTAEAAPIIRRPRPDPTQGARAGLVGGQLTSDDARHMTPSQIVAAKKAGQFDDLLAGRLR